MRICAAQTRPVRGDIPQNIANHKRLIDLAASQGANIVIFPELSLTGYEPELANDLATSPDDSRFDDFQTMADTRQITIGVGVPTRTPKDICISMVLFHPNAARQTYNKKYIHADEEPFFVHGQNYTGFVDNYPTVALAICYELSVPQHAEDAAKCNARFYFASVVKTAPQLVKATERLLEIAKQYSLTVIMANCVGESSEGICGGKSSVWNNEGALVGQLDDTSEGILILDTETKEVITRTV